MLTPDEYNTMLELMYESSGVGLAAPQVGISKRCFVMDSSCGEDARSMMIVNDPTYEPVGEKLSLSDEGCLSLPGITAPVERLSEIRVTYTDQNGNKVEKNLCGIESIIFQHELDHIDGVLFIDKLMPSHRRHLVKRYRESGT